MRKTKYFINFEHTLYIIIIIIIIEYCLCGATYNFMVV